MTVAKEQLRSFVERIERLEEEKKELADDIRDVLKEAKSSGFDTKALRQIIRLRKIEAAEREAQQLILETYLHALGMLADTPLGEAAIKRTMSLTKPSTLPDKKAVKRIADRAEGRA